MRDSFDVEMNEAEWKAALSEIQRKRKAINSPWMKSTHRRNLRPIANTMKSTAWSSRFAQMIGITTAKRRTGDYGAKVGVVKNDAALFPVISAPALASLKEYGSDGERFRGIRRGAFVVGAQSTGVMPAEPRLRPAWDANVRGFMDSTEKDILDKIDKEGAS